MLAWILIFWSWVALVSLILHDVTKEDADGGAIRVAAGNVGAAVSWAMLKAGIIGRASGIAASQGRASRAAPGLAPEPVPKHLLALRLPRWRRADQRTSMTIAELEAAIAEAVRTTSSGCAGFISVIVERKIPKSRLDPDWAVRGVRYGKADRRLVDQALSTVVERMQQEIRLKHA
ncbi:hypothetical protein [Bradyrhizobium sp.]|uniref:hypothetical protein n=1 Tax=Bradyrhizobium sp. TaxID=376 RepID=UPI003C4A22DD